MICIIAGNYDEAQTWAQGQNLRSTEWFYPTDENDIIARKDFHVLVVGSAGHNVPAAWFNRFYELAQKQGRIK